LLLLQVILAAAASTNNNTGKRDIITCHALLYKCCMFWRVFCLLIVLKYVSKQSNVSYFSLPVSQITRHHDKNTTKLLSTGTG